MYVLLYTSTYLWSLTRGVIRIFRQDNILNLVQNTVCFLEIPTSLFPGLIGQILLEEIKQVNSLLVQVRKVSL